jgi:hypothetical protein
VLPELSEAGNRMVPQDHLLILQQCCVDGHAYSFFSRVLDHLSSQPRKQSAVTYAKRTYRC